MFEIRPAIGWSLADVAAYIESFTQRELESYRGGLRGSFAVRGHGNVASLAHAAAVVGEVGYEFGFTFGKGSFAVKVGRSMERWL